MSPLQRSINSMRAVTRRLETSIQWSHRAVEVGRSPCLVCRVFKAEIVFFLKTKKMDLKRLLFVDLCKESNIPVVLVHPLIITVLRRIRATKVSDSEAFLSMESQLEWIGDYSRQHQVSRELLLSLCGEQLDTLTTTMNLNYIPVGLLMEMNTFHNRRHYSAKTLLCWLQCLCPTFMSLTTMSLN